MVECLSRKHISEAQFLTLQESWQVVGPHSTDAVSKPCCKAYRERRKQWELAPKKSAAMGRTFTHPGKGDTHVSPPRCAPAVLQSASRTAVSTVLLQAIRILSLLVHVRSVSVNVAGFFILRATLVSIHWKLMLDRSTWASRAHALWIEMHRSFQFLLAAIKPMIKSPRFASVEEQP